eukprot:EG_transcript_1876
MPGQPSCHAGVVDGIPTPAATGWSAAPAAAAARDFVNLCCLPPEELGPTPAGKPQSLSNPLCRAAVCKVLLPGEEPPLPPPGRPFTRSVRPFAPRWPLYWTVALVPGLFICFVGFLAWGVPFSNLTEAIVPLATSIRTDVLMAVAASVQQAWFAMRLQCQMERAYWLRAGMPKDPFAEAMSIGRRLWPIILYDAVINSTPVAVARGGCVLLSNLQLHPQLGWVMDRQNCTRRWLERWDIDARQLTGEVLELEALLPEDVATHWPINATTPAQPFTWLSSPYSALMGTGDVLCANMGLFDPATGVPVGRAGMLINTRYLRGLLQQELARQAAMAGGRLAIYEEGGLVVAASHGTTESVRRLPLAEVADPDLQAAARVVAARAGPWCPVASVSVALSTRYFLDTYLVADTEVSVQKLEWCVLLLAPRANTMAPVDRALWFAVVVVCGTTCGVTALSFVLSLCVTRPIMRLTKGMRALQLADLPNARLATGRKSFFAELLVAQEAYDALVGVVDAFGKYVPQPVVRGLLDGSVRAELGMTEKHVALAFMDVENFTAMCESTTAEEIVQITSSLFDQCCDMILGSHGTVDKFLGDCIMALWGAPTPLSLPGRNALEAVHSILQFLAREPVVLRSGARVGVRIGLNGGACLVGNFGASARWDYTAIGDAVNIAARLEPLNKQFGTHCLVAGSVYDQARGVRALEDCMRPMGDVLLVGKQNPVRVYELQPVALGDSEGWAAALQQYAEGQLDAAAEYFASLPGDSAAEVLLREVQRAPPGPPPRYRVMRAK